MEKRELAAGNLSLLAPPADCPQELVGALLDFLPGRPEIKAAYLASRTEPPAEDSGSETGETALLIGLETEAGVELDEMIDDISSLVIRHLPDGQAVDFTQIRPDEKNGLGQWLLKNISPFYRRSLTWEAGPDDGPAVAEPEAGDSQEEKDKKPGFFGRLTRVFKS
jgi:hypothetical protein